MSDNGFEKVIGKFKIDPVIFTSKFVKACDVCKCSGECCYYGVYTESTEWERIMKDADDIKELMDDSQTRDTNKWFEAPVEDDDFDSGIAVGTEVYNGKCVFLDKQGFCTLQKLAMKRGESKWKYKPLYCILFPLVVTEGILTVDDDHLARMHYCNVLANQVSTVYEACKEELRHLLGEEGFAQLEVYREEYLSKTNSEVKVEN